MAENLEIMNLDDFFKTPLGQKHQALIRKSFVKEKFFNFPHHYVVKTAEGFSLISGGNGPTCNSFAQSDDHRTQDFDKEHSDIYVASHTVYWRELPLCEEYNPHLVRMTAYQALLLKNRYEELPDSILFRGETLERSKDNSFMGKWHIDDSCRQEGDLSLPDIGKILDTKIKPCEAFMPSLQNKERSFAQYNRLNPKFLEQFYFLPQLAPERTKGPRDSR